MVLEVAPGHSGRPKVAVLREWRHHIPVIAPTLRLAHVSMEFINY